MLRLLFIRKSQIKCSSCHLLLTTSETVHKTFFEVSNHVFVIISCCTGYGMLAPNEEEKDAEEDVGLALAKVLSFSGINIGVGVQTSFRV